MRKGCGAAPCLLQMLLLPLCLAEGGQETGNLGTVQCLNNYGLQALSWLNCTWQPDHHPGPGPFYLLFSFPTLPQFDLSCQLLPSGEVPGASGCSMSTEGEFTENDEYHVSLHDASPGKNRSYTVFPAYRPSLHIRCDPPYDLQSNVSASKCRLRWRRPAAYGLMDSFHWELAFKATAAPWGQAQTRSFVSRETWTDLEGSEFEPGGRYVARLRLKLSGDYGSEWSAWSPTSEWAAPPGTQPPASALLLLRIALPLGLGALLVLLLALRALSRTKGGGGTPTPATFFQPLYASHNGNFQRWAGLKEGGGWLRSSKGDGARPGEAVISPVSILQQLPKATVQERALLPLPGAPDWSYVGSSGYEVLEAEEQLPQRQAVEAQLFSSGASPRLQGPGWPHKGPRPPQQAPCGERESVEEGYCTLGGGSSQQSSTEQLPRLQGLAGGRAAPQAVQTRSLLHPQPPHGPPGSGSPGCSHSSQAAAASPGGRAPQAEVGPQRGGGSGPTTEPVVLERWGHLPSLP